MSYKPSPHRILGISHEATPLQIKTAYRELAKKWHPDKYPGKKSYAEEQFKRIKEAYESLIESDESVTRSVPPPQQMGSRMPFHQNVFQNMNFTHRNIHQAQTRPMNTPQFVNTTPRPSNASVLCNGTVLLSGGMHPSNLTVDMLRQMQRTANAGQSQNCNQYGCFR